MKNLKHAETAAQDKSYLFGYYWRILSQGLPEPVPEYRFSRCIGRKHRFDWAWPEYRIAVEVDGGQHAPNGGRHASDSDREKLNLAASLRWLVFRFSPDQLKRGPEACIALVAGALRDSQ